MINESIQNDAKTHNGVIMIFTKAENKTKPSYRVKFNKAWDGTWKKQSECCLQCLTKVFKQWAIDSLNAQALISNYYKILDWYGTQNDLI